MRNEQEMFNLILKIAEQDERVRAVYMNGSRTNPNVPKDIFQDYDIVYVVTETTSFRKDKNWIQAFGELLMVQEPEKNDFMSGGDVDLEQNYGYLMLFTDGNRIDLHIQTKDYMLKEYQSDSLTVPIYDKDNCLPKIPPSTDKDYWVKKPIEAEYFNACNDFWWCLQNVAKGIWREELPYAKQMFALVIRPRLDQIVSWWIGMQHAFKISPGKMGKYFNVYLSKKHWEMYKDTYSDCEKTNFWHSLFQTCELFRELAMEIAKELSFTYPIEDDRNMTMYLYRIRELPKDANGIF
ncbi:aminoglycoside 6-adenylyltransferase [Ornithinibacillus xuwenensis]|uniref:Aminoglycoside 6-adenylyltransferase n=1 Tax=Ornithinibacillus xuwenensis TaxID=3144668 RepID=A0ABU9XKS4_9BACI